MKRGAMETLRLSRDNPGKRFPDKDEARFREDLLFPSLRPKFAVETPAKVFTIGSCFARNIELALEGHDIELPTMDFSVPPSEWDFRPNGILNEYNAGTISQRVLSALGGGPDPEETMVDTKDGTLDLLLPAGHPVTRERAFERRAEIEAVYREMASSDLVILTLGLVEVWFDEQTGMYLNRMPPRQHIKRDPERYTFRRLDVFDALPLLEKAMRALVDAGMGRILITVSPVPLGTTFTGDDVVVANGFSKAVLRVCAERLAKDFPEVDYFPSYELVTSGGVHAFNDDNIHVRSDVVNRVTAHMLDAYFPGLQPEPANGQGVSPESLPAEGDPVDARN